jgi:hypothetical protein
MYSAISLRSSIAKRYDKWLTKSVYVANGCAICSSQKREQEKGRAPKNKDPVDPLEFVGTKNGKEYVATMACLNCR